MKNGTLRAESTDLIMSQEGILKQLTPLLLPLEDPGLYK